MEFQLCNMCVGSEKLTSFHCPSCKNNRELIEKLKKEITHLRATFCRG